MADVWLRGLGEHDPDGSCAAVLESIEWQLLYRKEHGVREAPTIGEAPAWIAKPGGYSARRSDPPPGVISIRRGWQRLSEMVVESVQQIKSVNLRTSGGSSRTRSRSMVILPPESISLRVSCGAIAPQDTQTPMTGRTHLLCQSALTRNQVPLANFGCASVGPRVLILAGCALIAGCQGSGTEPTPQSDAVENEPQENPANGTAPDITTDEPTAPVSDDASTQTDTEDTDPPTEGPVEQPVNLEPIPLPVQVNLALIPDKTFRIDWEASTGAEYFRVLENPDGISGYSAISENLPPTINSFEHRVALFNRVNARYIVQACNRSGCADSTEQRVPESLDQAVGYFKAGNARDQRQFGFEARQSGDGDTLAVKANNDVYVFARGNGIWQQQAYLESNGRDFGGAIDLSQDGSTLAVGAAYYDRATEEADSDEIVSSGAAYVFEREADTWNQQAFFKASNPGERDNFGSALSLSADGTMLVVGAPGEDSNSIGVNGDDNDLGRNHGAAYVFVKKGENWEQQAYLKSTRNGNAFGRSMDLDEPGDTLVIGASYAFHVYIREDGEWKHQFFKDGEDGIAFSTEVSLTADGNLLAVGAPSYSLPENSLTRTGAVFVYERLDGLWRQQADLRASNPPFSDSGVIKTGDDFGRAVSLGADGKTIAVGASGEESAATGFDGDQDDNSQWRAGAVYMFTRVDGSWQQQLYIKPVNSHAAQAFGASVSLDADGDSLAIGAPGENSDASGINGDRYGWNNPGSGAVFLY